MLDIGCAGAFPKESNEGVHMKVLFLWLLFVNSASLHAAETIIADMNTLILDDWEQESFKGHTQIGRAHV